MGYLIRVVVTSVKEIEAFLMHDRAARLNRQAVKLS
jgi:hypothetical protein